MFASTLVSRGVGSSVLGIANGFVGVGSSEGEDGDTFSRVGIGGGLMAEAGDLYLESSIKSAELTAKPSRPGVSCSINDFQVHGNVTEDLGIFN